VNSKAETLRTFQGSAAAFRFAIVVSRFNFSVSSRLLEGAERCLLHHNVPKKNWKVFYCPGSFELPLVADRLAAQKRWDAIICLGAIIRGETPHFKYISTEAARGIQNVALHHSLPVIFGVLTTKNEKQALERSGGVHGHKGWDAAVTAMEMAALLRTLNQKRKRKN
jgi:6,7-dimethyl-8-ribityllumazine synthase